MEDREIDSIFKSVFKELMLNWGSYRFFTERDVEWTLQLRLINIFQRWLRKTRQWG